MKSAHLGWLVAAIAIVGLIVVVADNQRLRSRINSPAAPANAAKLVSNRTSDYQAIEDEAIEQPSLIKLTKGEDYRTAEIRERRELIRQWCESDLAEWHTLSDNDQELLLFRLDLLLQDLIGEQGYKAP